METYNFEMVIGENCIIPVTQAHSQGSPESVIIRNFSFTFR